MIQNAPYSKVPLGLDAFAQANLTILKNNLKNILKESFKATFLYGDSEESDEIADAFAQTASDPLGDTINDYVQNAIKSQNIVIVPKTLVAGPVPVTGSMATITSDITII